jgi:hypothetical protein
VNFTLDKIDAVQLGKFYVEVWGLGVPDDDIYGFGQGVGEMTLASYYEISG